MYKSKRIAVVVPALNEQEHIAATLQGIPPYVDRVYVVDDASTDCTADIVRQLIAQHNTDRPVATRGWCPGTRIELVQHTRNHGVGAAIVSGYKRSLANQMDIVAVMAGDNQMDAQQLTHLLDPIAAGQADYVKGDRLSRPEHLTGMSPLRRCGNRLLGCLTRVATGNSSINDPQNGYTAISSALLIDLPLDRLYPRYGYCNQLLAWVTAHQGRLIEVPMPSRYLGERSGIRYSTYIPRVFMLLLRLFITRLASPCTTLRLRRHLRFLSRGPQPRFSLRHQ